MIIKFIRKIRQIYWSKRFKSCGKNFLCCSGTKIHGAKNIIVGDNVRFGEKNYINGRGGITFGNNIAIGPEVFMWSWNHNYHAPSHLPFDHVIINKPITVEDNVWIGSRSTIIPGITIGEGAVIAMGSVVCKDVPPCAVVGGNPAKVIKYRDIEVYNKLKQEQQST